jgi:predicted HD superfamily hydrolase involved in NAD metabolism
MDSLAKLLKPQLKSGRFRHTQGVVRTAARLARRHKISVKRVEIASWLHDCAKGLDAGAMKSMRQGAKLDAFEMALPPLWHAPIGAYLAKKIYGVRDKEILQAIRFHSTGAPKMTPLQKALFVADYIEPGRPAWPELKPLRKLALKNLDLAFLEVLGHKMTDLLKHKRHLHPRSVSAYHFALKSLA